MKRETAEAVASWWANQLDDSHGPEATVAFRDALADMVEREQFSGRETYEHRWALEVDYDPSPTLRAALQVAGIECRGFMFSAEGILPAKTRMKIWRDTETAEVDQIVRIDGRRVMNTITVAGPRRVVEVE